MKNKAFRSILIFFIISVAISSTCFASNKASYYLSYYAASISKTGNTIKVNFEVQGTGIMDVVGATEIYLYERESGSYSWTLVETYLSSDSTYTNQMINTNSGIKHSHVSYNGSSSMEYMAYVVCYAEKDGGSDSRNLIVFS